MNARELILLSPYRPPTHNTLYLGDEEVAAFLNGYTALWHPAALAGASAPPRLGSPYDYEQPTAGHVYAVPDNPPLILPDDWDERVRAAGAVVLPLHRRPRDHPGQPARGAARVGREWPTVAAFARPGTGARRSLFRHRLRPPARRGAVRGDVAREHPGRFRILAGRDGGRRRSGRVRRRSAAPPSAVRRRALAGGTRSALPRHAAPDRSVSAR